MTQEENDECVANGYSYTTQRIEEIGLTKAAIEYNASSPYNRYYDATEQDYAYAIGCMNAFMAESSKGSHVYAKV